jgi:hypothetical protein
MKTTKSHYYQKLLLSGGISIDWSDGSEWVFHLWVNLGFVCFAFHFFKNPRYEEWLDQ